MKLHLRNAFIIIFALVLASGCSIFRGGKDDAEALETVLEDSLALTGDVGAPTPPAEAAAGGSGEEYVLNELNFQVKKLGAEVKHLSSELRDLQGKSSIWMNPLTIYNKEIILENGSTIFGKIVYQDEHILKVETLIGYLIVERSTVVRIVENIPEEPITGGTEISSREEPVFPSSPANRLQNAPTSASQPITPAARSTRTSFAPNVVLVGTIQETKDRSSNLKLSGAVKNIGGRRADFVKVNFIFRKDWSGNTKTLTSFVKGSFHTFESGITSDASLLPGATAQIELYVPKSFGEFIGYSYTIDWEDY